MYVLYPFSSKTFWAGVDDTEVKAEHKLHQYTKKNKKKHASGRREKYILGKLFCLERKERQSW